MHLKYWLTQAKLNKIITAIEINPIDIELLFGYFDKFAKSLNIPLYYWNLGYESWQKIEMNEYQKAELTSDIKINGTVEPNFLLKFLLRSDEIPSGIYLLDDLCNFEELDVQIIREREALIANLERKYTITQCLASSEISDSSVYLVLLGEYLQFSSRLAARIPRFKLPLPDRAEVETLARTHLVGEPLPTYANLTSLLTPLQLSKFSPEFLLQRDRVEEF